MSTEPPDLPTRFRLYRAFAIIATAATLIEHVDDPDHVLTIVLWSVILAAVGGGAYRDRVERIRGGKSGV